MTCCKRNCRLDYTHCLL
ncbi:hypothetical protein LINPERPRIM_LOCUS21787 [Linum perenne]